MAIAHINIGSNIGDRLALLGEAVAAVERELCATAQVSAAVESEPWGFESPNMFLNVGINVEVGDLAPLELLHRLQMAQRSVDDSSHRKADGSYADRRVDIDLISLGTAVVDTTELTLPHPRMAQRDFVLRPMMELLPEWRHPILGLTAGEMLGRMRRGG